MKKDSKSKTLKYLNVFYKKINHLELMTEKGRFLPIDFYNKENHEDKYLEYDYSLIAKLDFLNEMLISLEKNKEIEKNIVELDFIAYQVRHKLSSIWDTYLKKRDELVWNIKNSIDIYDLDKDQTSLNNSYFLTDFIPFLGIDKPELFYDDINQLLYSKKIRNKISKYLSFEDRKTYLKKHVNDDLFHSYEEIQRMNDFLNMHPISGPFKAYQFLKQYRYFGVNTESKANFMDFVKSIKKDIDYFSLIHALRILYFYLYEVLILGHKKYTFEIEYLDNYTAINKISFEGNKFSVYDINEELIGSVTIDIIKRDSNTTEVYKLFFEELVKNKGTIKSNFSELIDSNTYRAYCSSHINNKFETAYKDGKLTKKLILKKIDSKFNTYRLFYC